MATLPKPTDLTGIKQHLDELGMLADPTVLREALREYKSGLDEQLMAISVGLTSGGRDELVRAAHRIAGSSSTLGAKRLSARAAELEHRTPHETDERIQCLVNSLIDEARNVHQYVDSLMAELDDPATIRRAR